MADVKISALPAVVTPATADVVPVVQGGVTKQETVAQLRTVIMPAVLTSDVTGVLPLANGGTNASAGLTTANGVVTSSGTALQQASGVLAGTNFLSVGTTPSGAGFVRFPYTPSTVYLGNKDFSGTDREVVSQQAGDTLRFGNSAQSNQVYGYDMILTVGGGALIDTSLNGLYALSLTTSQVRIASPLVGDTRASSPYSGHGKTTVATAPPFTVAAADYSMDAIMLSNAGAGTVTFPLPASDAKAYYKTVINTGAGSKTLSNGGVSQPVLGPNLSGRYLFDTAGVHLVSPTVAYP